MVISRPFIFSITARITSMGQGDPAMIPVRMWDRSYFEGFFASSSSSAMNIVGTPWTAVQRSLVIVSRTAAGEKVSTGTIVEPWVTQAIVPRTHPKQWKNGTGMHILSLGVRSWQSPMLAPLATRFRCRSIAPLGNPVVPEVYMMQMTSSGSQDASSASSALSEVSSAFAFISCQFIIHEYRFSPMYTTFRSLGNFSEWILPPDASRTSGHASNSVPG